MKKVLTFVMVFLMLAVIMPVRVYANSAEPPAIVIWSVNAPSDTQIVYSWGKASDQTAKKSLRLWEKVWFLYDSGGVIRGLTVRSSEKSFDIILPEEKGNGSFKSVYTLDFEAETLTENVSPLRTPLYMLFRIVFTLIIECGFYYLIGYREKKSYITFIAVNLITQMFVNLVINGGSLDIFYSYTLLVYIGMELLVFIFEMIALPITVKEKRAGWTLLWTFIANTISMAIGGIALLFVPY